MERPIRLIRLRLDRFGIALSGLCAVHCFASVVLVGVLGLGGQLLLAPAIHEIGLALAIGVGALTIGIGVLYHGRMAPLAFGIVGLSLMALALAAEHGLGEAMLTIAGVACVAGAHIWNLRLHSL